MKENTGQRRMVRPQLLWREQTNTPAMYTVLRSLFTNVLLSHPYYFPRLQRLLAGFLRVLSNSSAILFLKTTEITSEVLSVSSANDVEILSLPREPEKSTLKSHVNLNSRGEA